MIWGEKIMKINYSKILKIFFIILGIIFILLSIIFFIYTNKTISSQNQYLGFVLWKMGNWGALQN